MIQLILLICTFCLASSSMPLVIGDAVPSLSGPIFKSIDSGTTWTAISPTFSHSMYALAVDPSSPDVLYAGTGIGVFKTTDGGNHWVQCNGAVTLFSIDTIAIDPVNPSTIYAGGVTSLGGGVLKSEDAGLSWKVTYFSGPYSFIYRIVIAPENPAILYCNDDYNLFKSTDSGETWKTVLTYQVPDGAVYDTRFDLDPVDSSTLYVTGSNRHFYKTIDGGNNWSDITDHLAQFSDAVSSFYFTIDPIIPSVIYGKVYKGGNPYGIIKSSDGGNTWALVTDEHSLRLANLVIHSAASDTLYSASGVDLFKSNDQGNTWSKTGTPPVQVTFALDPANSSTIYAGGFQFSQSPVYPWIRGFEVEGKALLVIGESFGEGTEILFDGQPQPTKVGVGRLICKRGGKQTRKNPNIKIQVRNADGALSQELKIWLPPAQ